MHGYGEVVSNHLPDLVHIMYRVTTIPHFEWGDAKMLVTRQLKELLRLKLRLELPLQGAITIPIFIRFRQTAMEK